MDFNKLVAERVIIAVHSTDPHRCDVEEMSLQYRIAVCETVCALLCIRLRDFVRDYCVEEDTLLGVFDQIDKFRVTYIFSDERLVL